MNAQDPRMLSGYYCGVSCTPEDKTTEWWQDYKYAVQIKQKTGQLPNSRHRKLGKWVKANCSALGTIYRRGMLSMSRHARLNDAKVSALRKLGYSMDGSAISSSRHIVNG